MLHLVAAVGFCYMRDMTFSCTLPPRKKERCTVECASKEVFTVGNFLCFIYSSVVISPIIFGFPQNFQIDLKIVYEWHMGNEIYNTYEIRSQRNLVTLVNVRSVYFVSLVVNEFDTWMNPSSMVFVHLAARRKCQWWIQNAMHRIDPMETIRSNSNISAPCLWSTVNVGNLIECTTMFISQLGL